MHSCFKPWDRGNGLHYRDQTSRLRKSLVHSGVLSAARIEMWLELLTLFISHNAQRLQGTTKEQLEKKFLHSLVA